MLSKLLRQKQQAPVDMSQYDVSSRGMGLPLPTEAFEAGSPYDFNQLRQIIQNRMVGEQRPDLSTDSYVHPAPSFESSIHPAPSFKLEDYGGMALNKRVASRMGGLNPKFKNILPRIFSELRELGWQPKVASATRTTEEQREKVKKGYSKTMKSRHLLGNAVDIVDKRYGWDIPTSHQFWEDLGRISTKYGLTWGGNWKTFKDVAHVQF